mmetsp:Transcript_558/g.1235  ORF Transcript_558/g.1235 Transcript_558/m.1235 type:complete len:228 (-) Transcript_558:593-1276(-)
MDIMDNTNDIHPTVDHREARLPAIHQCGSREAILHRVRLGATDPRAHHHPCTNNHVGVHPYKIVEATEAPIPGVLLRLEEDQSPLVVLLLLRSDPRPRIRHRRKAIREHITRPNTEARTTTEMPRRHPCTTLRRPRTTHPRTLKLTEILRPAPASRARERLRNSSLRPERTLPILTISFLLERETTMGIPRSQRVGAAQTKTRAGEVTSVEGAEYPKKVTFVLINPR